MTRYKKIFNVFHKKILVVHLFVSYWGEASLQSPPESLSLWKPFYIHHWHRPQRILLLQKKSANSTAVCFLFFTWILIEDTNYLFFFYPSLLL